MTVVPTTGPAPWAQYSNVGMEDVDASDLKMPRLKIDGKTATFEHSISNANLGPAIDVIVLGIIKQRTFFPLQTAGKNVPPFCKSNDYESGFPTDPYKSPKDGGFPWSASGFNPQNFPEDAELGRVVLPCERCQFKEWREKTFEDNGRPRCQTMHTYALMLWDGTDYSPALLSIKSSGLTASGSFISTFATKQRPFFTATTRITLTPAKQGDVDYAIPKFIPDLDRMTDQSKWDSYVEQATSIRDLVRKPPRPFEKDDEGNVVAPEARQAQPTADQSWNQEQAAQGPAPAWAAYVQSDPGTITGTVVPDPTPAPPAPAQPVQPPPAASQPVAPPPVTAPAPVAPPQAPAPAPAPAAPPQAPPPAAPPQPAPDAEPVPVAPVQPPVQDQAPAPSTPAPPPGVTSSGLPF